MRLKGKAFLFGLIAAVTSVTGVFAAWFFTEGQEQIDAGSQDVSVDVTPSRRWEFDDVSVTFNASTMDGYVGKFGNGETTVQMTNKQDSCLNYDDFIAAAGSIPRLYDENGNVSNDYVFSYWLDTTSSEFNFDKSISRDVTLKAVYYSTSTYPTIYLASDTSFQNPIMALQPNREGSGYYTEFFVNDFIVPQSLENDHYIIRYYGNVYDTLSTSASSGGGGDDDFEFFSRVASTSEVGINYVVPGCYTVYFSPDKGPGYSTEWDAFGGYSWFSRQYRWALFGNPNNGWALTEETPFFGLVSSVYDPERQYDSIKTYVAKKVTFNDNTSYEFKPYEPYFDIFPHLYRDYTTDYPIMSYVGSETGKYIKYPDGNDASNDNLIFIDTVNERTFDITLTIKYAYASSEDVYIHNEEYCYSLFPVSVEISMVPSTRTVTFFKEDGVTIDKIVEVNDGSKLELDDSSNYVQIDENTRKYFDKWLDADTHEEIDFSTLVINSNQFVYPSYETVEASTTLSFANNYSYSNDSFSGEQNVYLYKNEPLTNEIISSSGLSAPSSISDGSNNYPVNQIGWRFIDKTNDSNVLEVSNSNLEIETNGISGEYVVEPILEVYGYSSTSTTSKPTFIQNIENIDYTINSSYIYVGTYTLGSNNFDGQEMNLITGSGIYRIWNDSKWKITRKIGLRLKKYDFWYDAEPRIVLKTTSSSTGTASSTGKQDDIYSMNEYIISSSDFRFYDIYIDYSFQKLQFLRMDPSNLDNNITCWDDSGTMQLTDINYSANNIYVTKIYNWYKTWTSSECVSSNDTVNPYRLIFLNGGGSSLWNQSNPLLWIHAYGGNNPDLDMELYNKTGNYNYVEILKTYTTCNFVRSNPNGGKVGSWSNVWNQTSNITIPSDKNCYVISGWGGSDGSWTNY